MYCLKRRSTRKRRNVTDDFHNNVAKKKEKSFLFLEFYDFVYVFIHKKLIMLQNLKGDTTKCGK